MVLVCHSIISDLQSSGLKLFQLRATDLATNIGAPAEYVWFSDQESPDIDWVTSPARYTASTVAAFSFNGTEGLGYGIFFIVLDLFARSSLYSLTLSPRRTRCYAQLSPRAYLVLINACNSMVCPTPSSGRRTPGRRGSWTTTGIRDLGLISIMTQLFHSLMPPHTRHRRLPCSSLCPCLSHVDWCLQSDVTPET